LRYIFKYQEFLTFYSFSFVSFWYCRDVFFSCSKFAAPTALAQPLPILALLQFNKILQFNNSTTVFWISYLHANL